jgi:CelD/BcsL family acetyltransferase involved in cellulose biosynthesis
MFTAAIEERFGEGSSLDEQWNSLCHNSPTGTAGISADILAELHRLFFPENRLVLATVRDSRKNLVAGLPLLLRQKKGFYLSLQSVSNCWWTSNQLVVDCPLNTFSAIEGLVIALENCRPSSVWLDWIPIDNHEWNLLSQALKKRNWAVAARRRFEVGLTRLQGDWNSFEMQLSKNTRKRARSQWKQILQAGCAELEVFTGGNASETERAFSMAMEIESRSWKQRELSSITSSKEAHRFYSHAVSRLSSHGALRIFFLKLDGRLIAFDLGEYNRSCYRSLKISYDEQYSFLSPGHVLNQMTMRYFLEGSDGDGTIEPMAEQKTVMIDSVGPMNQAIRSWSNQSYSVGRMVVAPGSWLTNAPGRSLVSLIGVKTAFSPSQLQPSL